MRKKGLIVYYSFSGNIESLMHLFEKTLNSDSLKISIKEQYPNTVDAFNERFLREVDEKLTPEIVRSEIDLSKYEVIYIASPNWCETFAPAMRTFLESINIQGKKIVPIISHVRTGAGHIAQDIQEILQNNTVTEPLVFKGREMDEGKLLNFLQKIF